MAISDFRPGLIVREEPFRAVYDYNHLLSEEHQKEYTLRVYHTTSNRMRSVLLDKEGMGVGEVEGSVRTSPKQNQALDIEFADLNAPHRGKKLGLKMYEALIVHAKHLGGATHVSGEEHSSMAHRVHKALAAKYGMKYEAQDVRPWNRAEPAPFDGKYGDYEYTIKSELRKDEHYDHLMQMMSHPDEQEITLALKDDGITANHVAAAVRNYDSAKHSAGLAGFLRRHNKFNLRMLLGIRDMHNLLKFSPLHNIKSSPDKQEILQHYWDVAQNQPESSDPEYREGWLASTFIELGPHLQDLPMALEYGKDHIDELKDQENPLIHIFRAGNSTFTPEQANKAMNALTYTDVNLRDLTDNPHADNIVEAIRTLPADTSTLEYALSQRSRLWGICGANPKLSKEFIMERLDDWSSYNYRINEVLKNPNVSSPQDLKKLYVASNNEDVQGCILQLPAATDEWVEGLFSDPKADLETVLSYHPRGLEFVSKYFDRVKDNLRMLNKLTNDDDLYRHPELAQQTWERFKTFLSNPSDPIRDSAREQARKNDIDVERAEEKAVESIRRFAARLYRADYNHKPPASVFADLDNLEGSYFDALRDVALGSKHAPTDWIVKNVLNGKVGDEQLREIVERREGEDKFTPEQVSTMMQARPREMALALPNYAEATPEQISAALMEAQGMEPGKAKQILYGLKKLDGFNQQHARFVLGLTPSQYEVNEDGEPQLLQAGTTPLDKNTLDDAVESLVSWDGSNEANLLTPEDLHDLWSKHKDNASMVAELTQHPLLSANTLNEMYDANPDDTSLFGNPHFSRVNEVIARLPALPLEDEFGDNPRRDRAFKLINSLAFKAEHVDSLLKALGNNPLDPQTWDVQHKLLKRDLLPEENARALARYAHGLDPEVLRTIEHDHRTFLNRVQKYITDLDPDALHQESVVVKPGGQRFRALRGLMETAGLDALPMKDLPPGNWNMLRKGGQKVITREAVDKYIDSLPSRKFNVSHGTWEGCQRHNNENSNVFQVNVTTDMVRQMKEAGVLGTFRDLQEHIGGAHPVTGSTMGWVRWTGSPDSGHVHLDEIQSDHRRPMVDVARAQALEYGHDVDRAVAQAQKRWPKEHQAIINKIVFGDHDPHEVLLEAFHQYHRDKGLHHLQLRLNGLGLRQNLSSQESEEEYRLRGETPPKDLRKPAVHYVDTYVKLPKAMGMQLDAGKYGDVPDEDDKEHKGKAVTLGEIHKHLEDLEKMSIGSIPRGKAIADPSGGGDAFDYSHVLKPEHLAGGYKIVVGSRLSDLGYTGLVADLYHKGRPVGGVSAAIDDDSPKEVAVDLADVNDDHRGKGLGTALYEAILAHARQQHNATHVRGQSHSSMASRVHQRLAEKHGLNYKPEANVPSPKYPDMTTWGNMQPGDYDARFAPYRYTIKGELAKSIRDFTPGERIPNKDKFDYSHLLSPAQRKAGYWMHVVEAPLDVGTKNIVAYIHHPSSMASVGMVTGEAVGGELRIGLARVNAEHQRKGLGVAAYEAVMKHAQHYHDTQRVVGKLHSSLAHLAHKKLAKKHGMRYRAEPNYEAVAAHPSLLPARYKNMNEDDIWAGARKVWESMKSGPFDDRYGDYDYTLKSEKPMAKMAIKDIPPASQDQAVQQKGDFQDSLIFDYSHLLPDHMRKDGYQLVVRNSQAGGLLDDGYKMPLKNSNLVLGSSVLTILRHEGRWVGRIQGIARKSLTGEKPFHVKFAEIDPEYRGLGLGMAAYEAAYAHAKHYHEATHVAGDVHSSMAHAAHDRIARKHGMNYRAEPNIGLGTMWPSKKVWEAAPSEPFDDKYRDYKYTLR